MSVSQLKTAGRPPAVEIRKKIIAVAAMHFARKGFKNTRVEDIATEVGLVRSAVLHHFGTKKKLYRKVLDTVYGESIRLMISALDRDGSCQWRLWLMIDTMVDQIVTQPEVAMLSLRSLFEADDEIRDSAQSRAVPYRQLVESFIRSTVPAADADEIQARLIRFGSGVFGQALYCISCIPSVLQIDEAEVFSPVNMAKLKQDLFTTGCRVLDLSPEIPDSE